MQASRHLAAFGEDSNDKEINISYDDSTTINQLLRSFESSIPQSERRKSTWKVRQINGKPLSKILDYETNIAQFQDESNQPLVVRLYGQSRRGSIDKEPEYCNPAESQAMLASHGGKKEELSNL